MEIILGNIDFAENRPLNGYSIGGELCISLNEKFFPEEHWYDCAYQDLKAWLPRLISFGRNHTDSCELAFLDGPYTLRLNRYKDSAIHAAYLRDHVVIWSVQNVDLNSLFKSALSCCRKYDRFLYENGKTNLFQDEIRTLITLLDT